MFQKPTFGNTSTGFGSFNATASTSSPFGGFKPQTGTSAFGAAPAFGATATAQPAQTGSFFGAAPATGGIFGSTAPATAPSTFGASTSGGFGFGAQNTSGGLFGAQNTTTGMFGGGQAQNTSFGAKPAGFGFGTAAASAAPPLFGGAGAGAGAGGAGGGGGLFPQGQAGLTQGGLFGNTTGGFGQQQPAAAGTAHVKYNPVVGTDMMVKSGTSQSINIKHHCITCMKEYENKSLEELRLEDYVCGNKGAANPAAGGLFSSNNTMFPANPAFGQPATSAAQPTSVFGGSTLGNTGFGQNVRGPSNAFSFGGSPAQATTTNLFGASKPAFGVTASPGTTNLFNATTTQAPVFGTNTSSFGFASNTQAQPGGLFTSKPATSGFGSSASTGFGVNAFSGGLFAAKPAHSAAPAFPSATPAFGTAAPTFGATPAPSGGLFNSFKPPAQTGFGFNSAPSNTLGTLGGGLNTSFAAKPAGSGFPSLSNPATGMFSGVQPATTLNFNTGNTGLGGGLSSGLNFGNTSLGSSLGTLGQSNMPSLGNNTIGSVVGGNVHEQILNLAARPYGDWPLFKDLPDAASEDPPIPAAAAGGAGAGAGAGGRGGAGYRVAAPDVTSLTVHCRPLPHQAKKSLFDGLEESDASLEDKLTLKPSRKRLVLRPKAAQETPADSNDHASNNNSNNNRSLEDSNRRTSLASPTGYTAGNTSKEAARMFEEKARGVNTDLEDSSERHSSWLGSSKLPWNDSKEKPVDDQPTPRLYPDLDRELQPSERRASWLTTKPLHKKSLPHEQDSVRELHAEYTERIERTEVTRHTERNSGGVDKENLELHAPMISSERLQFCAHRSGLPTCSRCEKIQHQIRGVYVSEKEHVAGRQSAPHPTGVKLTRPGYYTVPSLDDMISYIRPDGRCVVPHLTIGRKLYGNVYFDCEIDVTGLNLDALVHFLDKEVIIYPSDSDKPPVGCGLNRRAVVTLDRVWPRDKTERRPVTDPERLLKMEYEAKLRRVCDKHDTKFIEYRPQSGSWVFRVEHFSKYGLTDSDEEDDITPEVMKRQLVNQALQKNAATVASQIPLPPVPVGLGGLMAPEDNLFAMQQSSLNLLSNAGKAFEMDTEDNAEGQSMYPEINRAFGVKSPTSELARLENRHCHNVQLMKASLYADTDMEDDNMSVSTGDQLVPQPTPLLSLSHTLPRLQREDMERGLSPEPTDEATEYPTKPLVVQPHTIVLKYHRKIPPFKETIAGTLNASTIADMSVCRARHSRVGFGPGNTLVFVTTAQSVCKKPKVAELSELNKYVTGRGEDDWSEQVVVRMRIGDGDKTSNVATSLSGELDALLDMSALSTPQQQQQQQQLAARLVVKDAPRDRRALLERLLSEAAGDRRQPKFGVSGAYCREVWRLCEALWAADLDNDGVAGTDEQSIVQRHKAFAQWLTGAVADETDEQLAKTNTSELEDETDGHSARIVTLLAGGRTVEACKLSREHGDLNMAAIIAQAGGDNTVRRLITRQLSSWVSCGADALVSTNRRRALRLVGGGGGAGGGAWTLWMHQAARYLCPQVPSLEQIVRKYESMFRPPRSQDTAGDDEEEVDLTLVTDQDNTEMPYPLPPYQTYYDISVVHNGDKRRVLDLRYELIRARALNSRPRLQPAAYTPDALDYSLCFLIGAWTGNLQSHTVTSFAEQLEAAGAWHRAVQVLSYLEDDVARTHLIRGVISRHMPAHCAPEDEKMKLLQRLRVPEAYTALAIAHRAKYQHEPLLEAENLLAAKQYNAAHRVLLDELLPTTVLADKMDSIAPLLERMQEAAARHQISGWERGGQALYHYLHVCAEIRALVSVPEADRSRSAIESRLEALRPRVAAACRALGAMRVRSPRESAALAEMGSRLVQSALAAGSSAPQLASLLRALRLPPDCTTHATATMTSELADRASEACIESTASVYPLRLTGEVQS